MPSHVPVPGGERPCRPDGAGDGAGHGVDLGGQGSERGAQALESPGRPGGAHGSRRRGPRCPSRSASSAPRVPASGRRPAAPTDRPVRLRPNSGAGRRVGREVDEGGQHLGPGHAVDDGVVDLGDERRSGRPSRPSTTWNSHRGRDRSSGRAARSATSAASSAVPPGDGQAGPAHVVVEVEVGVVDQRRVLEPEGHLDHPHAERGYQGHPLGHQRPDPAEAQATGDPGRVEHHGPHDVQMGGGRLQGQEGAVQSGQSGHALAARRPEAAEAPLGVGQRLRPRRTRPTRPAGPPAGRSGRPAAPGRGPRGRC